MLFAGVDAGSRAIKIVIIDQFCKIVASGVCDQGVNQTLLAETLLEDVIAESNIVRTELKYIVASGYGRDALEFADTTITEITCHARGVSHLNPYAKTIVDIGGQDSKLIRLEVEGRVRDFVMNDRCAAGTGRFLEVVAERMNMPVTDVGLCVVDADNPAIISSMCVVFAETEIIGLLASGERPENIVAGVQDAIATRIAAMGGRSVQEPVIFTGGVARIKGMDEALSVALKHPVQVSDHPQLTGALGAALFARERSGRLA
ncbi:rod shape-determining protein [bacterium]|nr:rod shape-determining protein [bacterium]